MALSDRLTAQIAAVKDRIDALEARHQIEQTRLHAQLQALKNLKQVWTPTLDTLVDAANVRLDES
jgi:septal ring factor EnvC (AmiA/AmiB activator)